MKVGDSIRVKDISRGQMTRWGGMEGRVVAMDIPLTDGQRKLRCRIRHHSTGREFNVYISECEVKK